MINWWYFVLVLSVLRLDAQHDACLDPLPDFDYTNVGYKKGQVPLPYGQGQATFYFEEGRYVIDSLIRLEDGEVLRGAGRNKTVLFFPRGLRGLGAPCGHEGVDCYDWSNGVIRASGKEIGIEDLTIEFPEHDWCHYCGKQNQGYNGISMLKCEDCWIKNVNIRNCDSGVFIEGSSNNITVADISIWADPTQKSHLQVAVSGYSTYVLVSGFKVFGSTFHGLTANWGAGASVFSNGWGDSLRIEPDHNCNGAGGPESCCLNIMYTNIKGSVESIQTHDRANNELKAVIWNVGEQSKCPQDAYQAQLKLVKE